MGIQQELDAAMLRQATLDAYEHGSPSIAYITRKCGIGYTRARSLLVKMHENGTIRKADDSHRLVMAQTLEEWGSSQGLTIAAKLTYTARWAAVVYPMRSRRTQYDTEVRQFKETKTATVLIPEKKS